MKKLSDEMDFFIFLLEYYARHKNMSADQVLRLWDEKGISRRIYDGYWGYHTERLENAYEDIDSLIATGKHAW